MATLPTIANILRIAGVCQYLAMDGSQKDLYFKGNSLNSKLSREIYITRSSVQWLYTFNPTDSTLDKKGNFLYSLCYPYVAQAKKIINAGTTGTIINPSTGGNMIIATPLVQFAVGDIGAPILNGQTSMTLNYAGVINPSIDIFLDGTNIPYGVNDRISFTATYNPTNIVIVLNQAVSTGQLYAIHMVQIIPT